MKAARSGRRPITSFGRVLDRSEMPTSRKRVRRSGAGRCIYVKNALDRGSCGVGWRPLYLRFGVGDHNCRDDSRSSQPLKRLKR
jgi:hypothetical protein